MSFLITRPNYDPATRYLHAWSQEIITVAKNKKLPVFDLHNKSANKKELSNRIQKLNPKLVVLNGHGDDDLITGQDNEPLIEAGKNDDLLHNRITYAVSCRCGRKLGPKVARTKGTAFIGYDDDFVFSSDRKFLSRPMEDKRAKPFMEASNHVAISLLKGHSASESSKRSKEMFETNFKSLLSSASNPDSLQDARFLWWDMTHQVCLGEMDARM